MRRLLAGIGGNILNACDNTGDALVLLAQSLRDSRSALAHPRRVIEQMKRVGNDTLLIAAVFALFIGMVLALQVGNVLDIFNFVTGLPPVVAWSLIKELGPVLTALLVAGRVGASIAAEVGTMQINEEIDALHTLGISPVRFLAVPRFIACVIMMPVLATYASAVGIIGGGIVANATFRIGWEAYFDAAFRPLEFGDVVEGLIVKSALFGAIIAIIACQCGLRTRGGAEGVGKAITSSVVASFMAIIVCNYFVTRFML
mgnify:CR=1 FL=1